jgi:chaperonin GroEL
MPLMPKKLQHGDEARKSILTGVDTLANAVRATLGPCGRNVVIEHLDNIYPSSTKDGVTVAKAIDLEDPFENMGAQMVKQVASQTVNNAGDGTTTAVVLAQAIYREGLKAISVDVNPTHLKKGIDLAVEAVKAELKKMSQEVSGDAVKQVGTISANGDTEIGGMIAEALAKVGRDGVIAVQGSESLGIKLDVTEGMQIDRGYIDPGFVNNEGRAECVFENPYIFLYDRKLATIDPIVHLLQGAYNQGRPILIIAEDVEGQAKAVLLNSKSKGASGVQTCAVKSEGYLHSRTEHLKDVAAMTGGTVFAENTDFRNVTLKDLGEARKVVVGPQSTVIVEGMGDREDINARAKDIKSLMEASTDNYERLRLNKRLARLISGVAVIKVGGITEIEMTERKDRVEDAMFATRCAVEEGVVPGGGTALVRCLPALRGLGADDADVARGVDIIRRSIKEPLKRIAENAGKSGETILAQVCAHDELAYGYNAKTGFFENLMESGVLDPAKVVRSALENAASVAGLMLITEAMISFARKDSDNG